MRVKDTLNLGKTKFPMRGKLPVTEAQRESVWEENKVYELRQKLNEGKPTFILHDGPPYANGNIHIGHAMNKISKDFIVRYKSMSGYRSPYVPGWDTHGLPIEHQLTKAGYDRKKMSLTEFRDLCRKYALEQVDKQRTDFKRLGVSADWDHPYLTLNKEFEAAQIHVFGEFAKKGLLYQAKKPVYWSWSSESALAEAEVEYHDVTAKTAFFAEQVKDGKGVLDNNTYLVVWTTTPWTIPASEAVAVNAKFDYSVIKPANDERQFVVATDLLDGLAEKLGWEDYKVVKHLAGKELEGLTTQHPYLNRDLLVGVADYVTADAGTGLVHTAPGYGDDDYNFGKKYDLPIFAPINDQGVLTKENGDDFDGVFYQKADDISLQKLEDNNALLLEEPLKHSYPFDWRTKKPIIFRATDQWFVSIEKMRQNILDALENVKYYPEWGKVRLRNMIKDRGDWVISRQRVWGVPLPIFYAEDGTPIMEEETINHVADLFRKYGSNVWFERDAKDLLPEGYTNEHSPHGKFTKETDIMDVWFDSGSSHQGVLTERDYLTYPADLYLEGSDQYRGWFNSSLITSVVCSGHAPYKSIVSQGFTLDKRGNKMSKSQGNVIDPNKVVQQMGAEIIRLWVMSADTSADVRVSMGTFQQISEAYRKLRNTFRFLLANTSDFDASEDTVSYEYLSSVDQYMLVKLNHFLEKMRADFDNYDFLDAYRLLINFVNNDLSAFYMNIAKDVLYIEPKNSQTRRSMQTVFYDILVTMVKLLTPILPHTAEEVWSYMNEPEDFVQLTEIPEVRHFDGEDGLLDKWSEFMEVRSHVLKSLEEARNVKMIGKSLEAQIDLYVNDHNKELLESLNEDVQLLFGVSKLVLHSLDEAGEDADQYNDGVAVKVSVAPGETCQRCRMVKEDIGSDSAYPTLCARCAKVVRENFPETVDEGLEK
ncbi:isoleucine--tRNA ligase [Limosilactobacillus fastidiosus]|uniref:Isoleucine--tRNA ligase n=1 Tax=Limosilactobacillus fastidiosus TaxID=2759855 RepID=A0A7W3YBG5_9LACO|nr:isoleucine--tRNA ligase [Limosilactobacillus fastidiosus]MBB1062352.1 isoleucine--tRNA ligase [Limosilactobacillus fastidiosus]MBB1085263.1 isoleucine--tRNA ligase [Limosilactobacillus fastidiosus]MCD7083428.1 isoleucine--tRNA ligase [Limosilactobacillus fastidiosus]MCD7085248.1 isoleucine--tRNA ligase [Limosilactobacillus fastidiosus]MCD7115191.1 isoleucine--tRNA ligase [Limosilactobacillus fastidiosus]